MVIKKRRGAVGHKTRLGPRLWEKLLDPSERVQFHIHGTLIAIESLEDMVSHLKPKDRQKLLKHLEEMDARISSLVESLKTGGT